VHVLLSCAQLGMTQQLFHDHGWNGPFISAQCRKSVTKRVPGEMRNAKSLADRVDLAVDQIAIRQRSASLASEEPVFRCGFAGVAWERAYITDVRAQDRHQHRWNRYLTSTSFRLGSIDLSPANRALDLDDASIEIEILNLQSKHLADPQASRDG